MDETRQITREEVLSILDSIRDEIRSDKVTGLGVVMTNIVTTESKSPLIFSAHTTGKQIQIVLSYEEDNG